MTDADGKERWFEAIKVPQFNDKGDVIELVGIASDITVRKHAELRQDELIKKLITLTKSLRNLHT
jgi:PAS domain S-box-containing protein